MSEEPVVKKRGRPIKCIKLNKEIQTNITLLTMANSEEKIDKLFDLMQNINIEFQSLKDKQKEMHDDLMLAITGTAKEANAHINSVEQEVNSSFESLTQNVTNDIEKVHENLSTNMYDFAQRVREHLEGLSQNTGARFDEIQCNCDALEQRLIEVRKHLEGLSQNTGARFDEIKCNCDALEQRLIEVGQLEGTDIADNNEKIENLVAQFQEFQQEMQEFQSTMLSREGRNSTVGSKN
jgi:cob(I)alamin adenosyltransferase